MRNLLAFMAAAVIVTAGAGWYLNWFKLSSKPDGDGHQNVIIHVDTHKVGEDVTTAVQKGEQIIEKDKSSTPKPEGKGVEIEAEKKGLGIKADKKGLDIKAGKIDVELPLMKSGN